MTKQRIAMRPAWLHLLFLHWEVEPEILRALLPPELEVDLFENRAYVGLVPFTMRHVRPRGFPHLPPLRNWYENFHEINVRTYVTHPKYGPGVWFFSLDAASAPAVCAARLWYKLPYFYAAMRLQNRKLERGTVIDYYSQRKWPQPVPATCEITYSPTGISSPAQRGTLDHFLVERYLLYSHSRGQLFAGRVRHKPYPLQSAELYSLKENLIAAAGIPRSDSAPIAHYASGVRVDIFAPFRVE
jgi:uncharacterized protein YqjF (DUF2071 family)